MEEAVRSILDQTLCDIELLVVDDASTDHSRAILETMVDARLSIIRLDINVGLAAALNIALQQATGTYVARMDADDIAMPDRLLRQSEVLSQHPNVVLVGTSYYAIDEFGTTFDQFTAITEPTQVRLALSKYNPFCHPSVMIRRESLTRVGGYRDIAGRYAQDYDLWLRLAELGEMMNLAEPLLKYRVHERQVSVAKAATQRFSAELYKLLALQRREQGREDIGAARKELASRASEIKVSVVQDMLHWANTFEAQGKGDQARSMRLKALRAAPFSQPVRGMLADWLRSKVSS